MAPHSAPRLASPLLALLLVSVLCPAAAAQRPAAPSDTPPSPRDALQTYRMDVPPLAVRGDLTVRGDGFGSAVVPVPGKHDEFFGLSDRGPNADGPVLNRKLFPVPGYHPAIGRFRLKDGKAELVATITLKDAAGKPLSGLVPLPGAGATGETAYDGDGQPLAAEAGGIDPEGLAVMHDGTFWVSDEYGPSISHFKADGTMIEKIGPFAPNLEGHRLPAVLAKRTPNRGIEGLAVTPDGRTLVALVQSALSNGIGDADARRTPPIRIVTYTIATGKTREYLYLLESPATLGTVVSDITALSNTDFLVVEQDVRFPGAGSKLKAIYRISLLGATDVARPVGTGDTIDPARGLLLGGKTIEELTKSLTTAEAAAALSGRAIRPVRKTLVLDLGATLLAVDPTGRLFAHDKVEGITTLDGGKRIVLVNDCDFGVGSTSPPSLAAAAKIVPTTHEQDFGEILVIDMERLGSTAAAPR